jgi:hypothetical protein
MNLTWHIVKKDLRALKWPLLLWTMVIVAKLGVGVVMLTSIGSVNADWFANWFLRLDLLVKVLTALECVSFVLVAAVIHEDLLVGTTAFWMTRPIAGARLLQAKILGIGLIFGVLPVLVTLPWWLGCGYGLREIAWAALQTIVVQAICVLLGLLWGVVTDGFARFLLWTLVLLFAVPTISGVIGLQVAGLKVKPSPDLMLTRVWVGIAIAVLAILTVTVHQFLTRRTWRSVVMLGTAAGLIIAAGLWWPWDLHLKDRWNTYLAERAAAQAAPMSQEPAGLKFIVEPPRLTLLPGVPAERLNQVRTKFSVTGIPDTRVLMSWSGSYANLHWSNGEVERVQCRIRSNEPTSHIAAWRSLGQPANPTETTYQQDFTSTAILPLASVPRAQAERPTLTMDTVFRLLKFDSAERFPLQPGNRIITESFGERVAQVELMDGQILVSYVRNRSDFLVDQLTSRYPMGRTTYSVYSLGNQAAGKLSQGYSQLLRNSRVASVLISLQVVAYGDRQTSGKKNRLLEAWLKDAELIRQTFTDELWFKHKLDLGQFPTETANP